MLKGETGNKLSIITQDLIGVSPMIRFTNIQIYDAHLLRKFCISFYRIGAREFSERVLVVVEIHAWGHSYQTLLNYLVSNYRYQALLIHIAKTFIYSFCTSKSILALLVYGIGNNAYKFGKAVHVLAHLPLCIKGLRLVKLTQHPT